jgi:hypothetical protein
MHAESVAILNQPDCSYRQQNQFQPPVKTTTKLTLVTAAELK